MKNILPTIIKLRKGKGLTYENMANDLNLSVAAYRKIELNQTNLTVERLYQIAEILQVSVAQVLDIEKEQYHQTNNDNTTVFSQKIENFYQENKETYEKLINALNETILSQKETITTLKSQMQNS